MYYYVPARLAEFCLKYYPSCVESSNILIVVCLFVSVCLLVCLFICLREKGENVTDICPSSYSVVRNLLMVNVWYSHICLTSSSYLNCITIVSPPKHFLMQTMTLILTEDKLTSLLFCFLSPQVHQYRSESHDAGTPEKVGVRFYSEDRTLSTHREGSKERGSQGEGERGSVSAAATDAATTGSNGAKSPASVSVENIVCNPSG